MKLLLTAATQNEIQPYLSTGPLHDVLISGTGIAATAFRLTKHLAHQHYDVVIQAGIAGTFTNAFAAGSVVAVAKDVFADMGAWEDGEIKSLSDLQLSNDTNWYKATEAWLHKAGLPIVNGATVATITDNMQLVKAMHSRWQADIETMEGAACYYVCNQLQKNCLQLRSISNTVGDRNKGNWQMKKSIENLNAFLLQFIPNLLRK